jgi:hypothetical protein
VILDSLDRLELHDDQPSHEQVQESWPKCLVELDRSADDFAGLAVLFVVFLPAFLAFLERRTG